MKRKCVDLSEVIIYCEVTLEHITIPSIPNIGILSGEIANKYTISRIHHTDLAFEERGGVKFATSLMYYHGSDPLTDKNGT